MTTQAIPAIHLAASLPSIPPRPAIALDDGDVSVTVTFRPLGPIGATEVVASIALPDDTGFLTLLDATITRLIAYRDAYQQAMTENDYPVMEEVAATVPPPPLPLPVPWYAW